MSEHPNDMPALRCSDVHILLVEDNQVNQIIVTMMIKKYGCSIVVAANGSEAVQYFETHPLPFDLIFMDCQMPVMDGFQATVAIRQLETRLNRQALPIVALTANDNPDDDMKCYAVGMNDYVKKPMVKEELERIFLTWLPREKFIARHMS